MSPETDKEEAMTTINATARPVRCINDSFGDPIVFASLEAMQAEVEALGYMPEDGLVEGRDYEEASAEDVDLLDYASIPAFYMFPETGSVDTEEGWRESAADNGQTFDPADFVEVCNMDPPALRGKSLSDCDPEGWMEIRRIADLMDTEIRERVHDESHWLHSQGHGYLSDQGFLVRYSQLHAEAHGCDFDPEEG